MPAATHLTGVTVRLFLACDGVHPTASECKGTKYLPLLQVSQALTRRPTRGDAFEFYIEEVIIPVALQSRRLIPHLLLPSGDPARAKPWRNHRFLDRVSRHEVPKPPERGSRERYTTPPGRRTYQLVIQCDTLRSRGVARNDRSTGLRGYAPRRSCDKLTAKKRAPLAVRSNSANIAPPPGGVVSQSL